MSYVLNTVEFNNECLFNQDQINHTYYTGNELRYPIHRLTLVEKGPQYLGKTFLMSFQSPFTQTENVKLFNRKLSYSTVKEFVSFCVKHTLTVDLAYGYSETYFRWSV